MRLFRFAAIVCVLLLAAVSLPAEDAKKEDVKKDEATLKPQGDGWVNLIDKDLKGWKFQADYWKVVEGVLTGETPGTKDHHYSYTEKSYADFELHADVKLVGYNSGICIRIAPTDFDNVPGYQVDMGEGYWGCVWDERGRGMVGKYDKKEADKIVKKNDWNHYYVKAVGPHIEVWLNGVKTVDMKDEKGKPTGPIGFQLCHGNKTQAWFKNVVVKEIEKKDAK